MSADFFIAFGVWVLLCAAVWACVVALRKRAKDGCYPPPDRLCITGNGIPHLPDCRCSPPLTAADREYLGGAPAKGRGDAGSFPAYVKALSDEDLWAMKGLSGPLAKIRKTEMDVRRRRKARTQQKTVKGDCNVEAALFKDPAIVGHVIGTGEPVFVNPQGSLTLEDPKEVVVAKDPIFDTGADANGAPVLDGPRRWRWSYGAENPRTILVTGPHPESDGLVAVIDLRAQTMSSVYVETTQAFPRGTDIDERMDADYQAWKAERA
jgi:hypothetical protein